MEEEWTEGNTPVFNKAVKEIVSRFFGEQVAEKVVNAVHSSSKDKYTAYRDNRLFTSSCYVLRGSYHHDSPQAISHEQLFQTALDVTSVNKDGGFPRYSKAFTENYFEPYTYRRWQDMGTLMGSNEYGNTYIGYGEYMYHEIAKINIPYIYHRVTLLNLSYRSQLRYFEGTIASQKDRTEASKLRSQFIDFANNKWFKTVTDQPQGDELFALQSKAFKLQDIYDQVNHEIAIADDYQRAENNKMFSLFAAFISIFTLLKQLIFDDDVIKKLVAIFFSSNGEQNTIIFGLLTFLGLTVVFCIALLSNKIKFRFNIEVQRF